MSTNHFLSLAEYNLADDISSFTYYYCDLTGPSACDPTETPGGTATGLVDGPVTLTSLGIDGNCTIPFSPVRGGGGEGGGPIVYDIGGSPVSLVTEETNPTTNYFIALNNIHYYASDPVGITHRDSLYYWLGAINSSGSKLATAQMLLKDGYTDSANTLFQNIPAIDSLDSVTSLEFTTWGAMAYSVQARIMAHKRAMDSVFHYAYANGLNGDSLAVVDSPIFRQPMLDSGSVDSLTEVFLNSRRWGRVMAEVMLSEYAPATYNALIAEMPDTVLYPADSLTPAPWPNGVLAVTEISQGPTTGCQYAEMIVANCGSDEAPYVNVAGWIIDDNSGNFDTAGCSANGITRGHYRLAPTSPIWQNIAVGSRIVIYNADVNCYGLPDTFTVDSVHDIFWIPVYATSTVASYVLDRFAALENTDTTSLCSDTGTTVYIPANDWEQTIELGRQDAVQVRCPGCTAAIPGTPPFYQGMGYAPDTTYCFVPIPASAYCLGGPVVYDTATYQKFVFTGSAIGDFNNPLMWTASYADPAGIPPPTAGYVDSTLEYAAVNHLLGLPCCASSGGGDAMRTAHTNPNPTIVPGTNTVQNIVVYPNPAAMMVYFQFPASGDVTIKLMTVTGQLMDEQTVHNNTSTSFNVRGYAAGIYIYQVITEGATQTGKIVVE